ncbi:UDP-glucose 4-epimerase [Streptomyces abyssalis]|uniref:UDP-glucose 4-epimerase n=1 Tax=Streptomyces abyssalis TaxID=933944 RepID=A0A1E7JSK5_9ACTN|nr:UDP-glucose 4-epimerase GalE [Streptomyces abyssalis]OEU91859.1 UDP-glucose 4-epimerase [Streptomyces abyssalis]OEU94001.1 UDP-glucose 4-epimerase [Streptomyces abyssalis]OEV32103.1 UDP-glucose 4-epimerase [Streptomyces nanshensis]
MTWLITGGAGYIGAHVARAMAAAGERVTVLDDLSAGVPERLEGMPGPDPVLVRGSVLDRALLDRTFAEHEVTGVVHLAARKQVGESVEQPLRYYRENVHGLTVLLEAVVAAGVRRFVFSSSAAVYGTPDVDLVTEETPCVPMNPYGETKLTGEWLVRSTGLAEGIATTCLRYFNVAGAAEPRLADTGVFNIVPMFFDALTRGEAPLIFGDDYPTPDGTCVRDYIHVQDLAEAHLAAARRLSAPAGEAAGDLTVNIGTGRGLSVREMADLVAEVTGKPDPARVAERRPGDPARVVASAELAEKELGWTARHSVREMIASAWEGWCLRHPGAR